MVRMEETKQEQSEDTTQQTETCQHLTSWCKMLTGHFNKFIQDNLAQPENHGVEILYVLALACTSMGVFMLIVSLIDGTVHVLPRDPLTMLAIVHLGAAFAFGFLATHIRKRNAQIDVKEKNCPTEDTSSKKSD